VSNETGNSTVEVEVMEERKRRVRAGIRLTEVSRKLVPETG